ncbi:MAG TPA: hypothetical protein VF250_12980 [Conexibacter sp.]
MGDSVAARLPRRPAASRAAGAAARQLTPGERAWLAVVPCAVLVVLLGLLLGPPLGDALLAPRGAAFWPSVQRVQPIRPEPVEHARYLIALLAPVLLCAAIVGGARSARLAPRWIGRLVAAGQATVLAALCTFLVAQRLHTYGPFFNGPLRRVYFTVPTLVAAGLLTLALVAALRNDRLCERVGDRLRETGRKRIGALAVAVVFTLLWLLTAVFFESSIGRSGFPANVTLPFSIDEAYAILDGLTPLVDFHAQYGQLWPYVAAIAMALFGASITTYTITMACGTAVAMLAMYALLRRLVRSSLGALLLYMPFVATGFFMATGPPATRYGPVNLFTIFPIRYGGPYLLAWLTVRHLDGVRPHTAPVLFCAAGIVALNNPEFGIAALGATFAALLWARGTLSRRAIAGLAGRAALGLLAALALLSLVTLLRAGSLPRLSLLLEFANIDGVEGWTLAPMPTLGFHLVLFVTFAAALAVATVRAVNRRPNVLLTAMLAWAGIFGLGAGSYFVGRSHPEVLIDLFSSWALAVALLTLVVVRAVRARPSRRPLPAELAVLFALGLCVCSLAQLPTPWSQIERLRDVGTEGLSVYIRYRAADQFVAEHTRPGETVLILHPVSHRVAYEHGLRNVLPWVSVESMPLERQFDDALEALRKAGGRKLFLWVGNTWQELTDALPSRGFELRAVHERLGFMEWVATRP